MISEKIENWNNMFLEDLKKCKNSGYPTYVYGGGEGASNVEKRIEKLLFSSCIQGKVVDKKYLNGEGDVLVLQDILKKEEKINLVVAFNGYKKESLEGYEEKINIIVDRDCWSGNCYVDDTIWTKEFIVANENNLEYTYNNLEDQKSKDVLLAYINQKITMEYGYLGKEKTYPQYFEREIIQLDEGEVFVDCGAYDGDSAEAFINACGKKGYKKIISFEPDPLNYKKLVKRNYKNHECLNLATSDKDEELCFSISSTSSSICEKGEVRIKAIKMDDKINEQVTMIKMDIEGAELASLKGAERIIKENRPKLAICIYHKKEDIWEILSYIKKIVPEYKFYMRAYEDFATELVLYAIP